MSVCIKNPEIDKKKSIPNYLNDLVSGHSILVSESGEESFFWKLELLKYAKYSIELSGNYCGGEPFQRALYQIKSSMRRNPSLKVHLLTSPDFLTNDDTSLLEQLQREFGNQFKFLITKVKFQLYPRVQTIENHIKLLVIDETYFIIGGTGIRNGFETRGDGTDKARCSKQTFKDSFLSKFWRDNDLIGKGEIAKRLRAEFFKLFAAYSDQPFPFYFPLNPHRKPTIISSFERHDKKLEKISLKVVIGNPENMENKITNEYCRILDQTTSHEEIWIGNMLFNPCPQLYRSITKAIQRNVKTTLITNHIHIRGSASHHLFFWPNRLQYYPLMQIDQNERFQIYEYAVPDTIYHGKTWTAGSYAIFGSYNFGLKSHYADYEIALIVHSKSVADHVKKLFKKDIKRSIPVREEEARRWRGFCGLAGRLQNALISNFWG